MSDPIESQWRALASHATRLAGSRIADLFAQEPGRLDQLVLPFGDLVFDFSKHKLDRAALASLLDLAAASELKSAICALFRGDPVNRSEQRPALHMALRAFAVDDTRLAHAGHFFDASARARAILERCRALVLGVRARFDDARGFDIVHVGIGGSELGPKLCLEALTHPRDPGRARVHFIGNVDAHPVDQVLARLDPSRTIVCLVSKSFTTQETLANGRILKAWLEAHLGETEAQSRLFAISANSNRAIAFGVAESQVLPIWEWVGGRYSVWSAVSFSCMLALGFERFIALLQGASAMDDHFQMAELQHNVPVMMALVGVWNRNVLGLPGHCVVPYDDRLRHLPAFLQQLEMESNGKSVSADGRVVKNATVPIIWGGVGSSTQHAFFQALHQGQLANVVEFIGTVRPSHGHGGSHRALLANLLAQSAALMHGRTVDERDPVLAAQRNCPGDRPSTTILLPELTPFALGALLAAYEHKVFVQSVLWGINAFDQWGVELGKQLADDILPALNGETEPSGFDASTRSLLSNIQRLS